MHNFVQICQYDIEGVFIFMYKIPAYKSPIINEAGNTAIREN